MRFLWFVCFSFYVSFPLWDHAELPCRGPPTAPIAEGFKAFGAAFWLRFFFLSRFVQNFIGPAAPLNWFYGCFRSVLVTPLETREDVDESNGARLCNFLAEETCV